MLARDVTTNMRPRRKPVAVPTIAADRTLLLINAMLDCQREASQLKLPLTHYFLDMAIVELQRQAKQQ